MVRVTSNKSYADAVARRRNWLWSSQLARFTRRKITINTLRYIQKSLDKRIR